MMDLVVESFDKMKLHCELLLPTRTPEFIAIFLHGSFLQDRDGNFDSPSWMFPLKINKRNLFRDIAVHLQSLGMGALIFDKRASGKSEGEYDQTTMDDLALDAAALLLETKRRYPNSRVGFVAQSEGTITAILASFKGAKPDFLVMQGSMLCGLKDLLDFQRTRAASVFLDNPSNEIVESFPYYTALYKSFYEGDLLEKIFSSRDQTTILKSGDRVFSTNLEKYRGYDLPKLPMLLAVECPTLLIHGDKDANCSVDDLVSTSNQIQRSDRANLFSIRILEDHDHSFRKIAGITNFIEAMALPLSPDYLAEIDHFFSNISDKGVEKIDGGLAAYNVNRCHAADLSEIRKHFVIQYAEVAQTTLLENTTLDAGFHESENPWYIKVQNVDQTTVAFAYYWYSKRCETASFALSISPSHRGKKLASEISSAIVKHVEGHLNPKRIEAGCCVLNKKCQRVLEKIGFKREGVQVEAVKIGDKFEDYYQYGKILR